MIYDTVDLVEVIKTR